MTVAKLTTEETARIETMRKDNFAKRAAFDAAKKALDDGLQAARDYMNDLAVKYGIDPTLSKELSSDRQYIVGYADQAAAYRSNFSVGYDTPTITHMSGGGLVSTPQ